MLSDNGFGIHRDGWIKIRTDIRVCILYKVEEFSLVHTLIEEKEF